MSANDNTQRPDLETLETAADWVDRLDELSPIERLELADWLKAEPLNATAFASVRRHLRDPALLAALETTREAAPVTPVRRARAARAYWAPIAAGLVIVAGGAALALRLSPAEPKAAPILLATAIGARSDYALSDASVIHLNADTQASVVYGKTSRDVQLHKGDAVFDVTKNPSRPFNVTAGEATVTAVGTSFEVDRVSDAVEVRVFEGAVRVSRANAEPRLVAKGQWLLLASNQTTTGRFSPEIYQGWRSDWLDAETMPLKYVVARLNRYTVDQVALSDPAMGELKVTGRFRLGRTNATLAMISTLLGIDAARQGSRIYLSPHGPSAATPPRRPARTAS